MSKPYIIYFSSVTEQTARFVEKLGLKNDRIPLRPKDKPLEAKSPFILITPTYGGGTAKGAVPKQVIKFLNNKTNRDLCAGVIASGNLNFGEGYATAGPIISQKIGCPYLGSFELSGVDSDLEKFGARIPEHWERLKERLAQRLQEQQAA